MPERFQLFSNLGDVSRPDPAGRQPRLSFKKSQAENIMVKEPELGLKGNADRDHLKKTASLLVVTKQPGMKGGAISIAAVQ